MLSNSKPINKVLIEGDIVRGAYAENNDKVFFATLKHTRRLLSSNWVDYYQIYAISPLCKEVAKLYEENPNAHVVVEGELRTRISKNHKSSKPVVGILINKIINIESSQKVTENPDKNNFSK